jgi:succinoglycan biosynthesis protein ExoV
MSLPSGGSVADSIVASVVFGGLPRFPSGVRVLPRYAGSFAWLTAHSAPRRCPMLNNCHRQVVLPHRSLGLPWPCVEYGCDVKLHYYRHPNGITNFGDELNPWIWSELLPGCFDDNPDTLFYGIGTLLRPSATDQARRLVVMGSGAGYFDDFPVVDERWNIYCVRGPLTASHLGIDPAFAVTDPAYLVREVVGKSSGVGNEVGYMPHITQVDKYWDAVCPKLGLSLIDPRAKPQITVEKIRHCRLLITEALHGAIVADALGVPWIPVASNPLILPFKWRDWLAGVGLSYEPYRLPQAWLLPRRQRFERGLYDDQESWTRESAKCLFGPIRRMQCTLALKRAARSGQGSLADRDVVSRKVDELLERVERFRSLEGVRFAAQ